MCGIFGWSFAENLKEIGQSRRIALAVSLAQSNLSRGDDSWGFYNSKGLMRNIGSVMQAPFMEMAKSDFLMAHTRNATTGKVKKENSHPFHIDGVVGAHNGIISNHDELNKKYNRDFEVDSMHLFAHIANNIDLEEIRGYGAIEYIKKGDNAVRLCKLTATSDLSIWGIKINGKHVGSVWSSSDKHAIIALLASGLWNRATEYRVDTGAVYVARGGNLYESKDKLKLGITQWVDSRTSGGRGSKSDWSGHCNRYWESDGVGGGKFIVWENGERKEYNSYAEAEAARNNPSSSVGSVSPGPIHKPDGVYFGNGKISKSDKEITSPTRVKMDNMIDAFDADSLTEIEGMSDDEIERLFNAVSKGG